MMHQKLRMGRTGAALAAAVVVGGIGTVLAQSAAGQQKPAQSVSRAAETVDMEKFEENRDAYLGKTITVEATVDGVLGPRVLAIDDGGWFDNDGNTLVALPAAFVAMVREGDEVTITGTVRPFVKAEFDREWDWFAGYPHIEVDLKDKAVIVATSIKLRGDNRELAMSVQPAAQGGGNQPARPTGTSGTNAARPAFGAPLTDIAQVASATGHRLVGREVNLMNVRVAQAGDPNMFWVSGQGQERLLVVPADTAAAKVQQGQTVAIQGMVLQIPKMLADKFDRTAATADESIYVYAARVTPSK